MAGLVPPGPSHLHSLGSHALQCHEEISGWALPPALELAWQGWREGRIEPPPKLPFSHSWPRGGTVAISKDGQSTPP